MTEEFDAEAVVAKLTDPTKFDLKAALQKKTQPEESVRVYLDGQTTHAINVLLDEIISDEADLAAWEHTAAGDLAVLLHKIEGFKANSNGGITDDPALEPAEAELVRLRKQHASGRKSRNKALDAKRSEVERLTGEVLASALTFKLRGLIRVQAELIDSKWRRKLKEPARGDFENDTDYESAFTERMIERNKAINVDMVQNCIIGVSSGGNAFPGGWTYEQTMELRDALEKSEWDKLENLAANLTFARTLFNHVATEDADFLPKP
jgi:hypothetical protein